MVKIGELFPSKFIAGTDLGEATHSVVIARVAIEEIADGEEKPVLYFVDKPKGMVLNKTNAKTIAKLHGDDTDDWQGKTIRLYQSSVDMNGETKSCIRVRPTAESSEGAAF